jgi:hypothetical protein
MKNNEDVVHVGSYIEDRWKYLSLVEILRRRDNYEEDGEV